MITAPVGKYNVMEFGGDESRVVAMFFRENVQPSTSPTGDGARSMGDHYTVISTEGDRRHTRTVIAANERDAKQTHREHYPTCAVTTVVKNGKP